MPAFFILAIPFSFAWIATTGIASFEAWVVGYTISAVILGLTRTDLRPIKLNQILTRVFGLLVYVIILFKDIFLSSLDVARRAISPDMGLKPGIIAVPTQDPDKTELIAALSSHGITITPGELVVYFDENEVMYVHCLNVEASQAVASKNQSQRYKFLKNLK